MSPEGGGFPEHEAADLAERFSAEDVRRGIANADAKERAGKLGSRRAMIVATLTRPLPLFDSAAQDLVRDRRKAEARDRRRSRVLRIVTERWDEQAEAAFYAAFGEGLEGIESAGRVVAWLNTETEDEVYRRLLALAQGHAARRRVQS